MNDLLGTIYSWFNSLWSDNLNLYLWGYDPAVQAYTGANIYNHVGLATLTVSLFVVLGYYYIYNHPRWCKWWSWLITLVINSVICLFIAYGIVATKYYNGYIPQNLVYETYDDGSIVYFITGSDCWGFAVGNFIVSAMLFIVLSFLFKWWSSNAKHVPFL